MAVVVWRALFPVASAAGEKERAADADAALRSSPLRSTSEPAPSAVTRARRAASAHELVAEGNRLLADGDYEGAIKSYGSAQQKRPNAPEVDIDLGLAHVRKGAFAPGTNLDRAAEYFEAAAVKGGGTLAMKYLSAARYNLGNVRVKQGRLEDAVEAYKEALLADKGNADASHNLDLVQRHLERLKKLEEMRKKAEEEFRKRLEALTKELAELVELQAKAVSSTWSTDYECAGPIAVKADMEKLQELGKEQKPVPAELAAKIARRLVHSRGLAERPSSARKLAGTERELSSRARKAAETAAILAADLRQASGQAARPSGPPQAQPADKPHENPLIGKLERAGGAADEAASTLAEAASKLAGRSKSVLHDAEPHEAVAFWKLVKALGELVAPPPRSQGQGSMPEEMKKLLQRMAGLRRRQAALVLDIWASFPNSRGGLPAPDEQKAFWEKVRSGDTPSEEERVPLARLEIAGAGRGGSQKEAGALAEAERALAGDARGLAAETEALAAKQGRPTGSAGAPGSALGRPEGAAALGPLLEMLRGAAEAMDAAAGPLSATPVDRAGLEAAEGAAVLAFVRLSRAPDQLTELLARLGQLLAEEMGRLLDTWASDATSRGEVPTPEELKDAQEEIAKALKGEAELDPGLEAKLGRAITSAVERAAKGAGRDAGRKLKGVEASDLQRDVAERAREAAGDMRALAAQGKQGEMNPAAPLLEGAAQDVDRAASSMDNAGGELPNSFKGAEPDQARGVAALMRALSRFASGAAGQSGGEDREQRGQKQERRDTREDQKKEGEKPQAERREEQPEDRDEKDQKEEKPKDVTKQQAEQLLKEAAQLERDVRRDIRKRTGRKAVEVRRDW